MFETIKKQWCAQNVRANIDLKCAETATAPDEVLDIISKRRYSLWFCKVCRNGIRIRRCANANYLSVTEGRIVS
jgi:hypothetical protein